jgi:opacity protein-like surface antigen
MKKYSQRAGAIAALLALAAVSQVAHAQAKAGNATTGYGEVSYLAATHKESSGTYRPAGIRLAGGADVMPGLGLEGMLAFGAKDGTSGVKSAQLSTLAGVYVKPHVELAPGVEVYARAGYANMAWSTKATASSTAVDKSGNSAGYGVGLNYTVGDKMTLGVDYMSYYNKSSVTLTGVAVSFGLKF